jgi:hypothetical protein
MRRWLDYKGAVVEVSDDVPLTAWNWFDQRTHAIFGGEPGSIARYQLLTRCGKRGCPAARNEIPGRGPVDCPECLEVS